MNRSNSNINYDFMIGKILFKIINKEICKYTQEQSLKGSQLNTHQMCFKNFVVEWTFRSCQRPFLGKKLYSYLLQEVILFQWFSTNFLVLKKIPGVFVFRIYTKKKLQITRTYIKIAKEKIFTCCIVWMLV